MKRKTILVTVLLLLVGCLSSCGDALARDPTVLTVEKVPYARSAYAEAYQYCRALMRQSFAAQGSDEADFAGDPERARQYLDTLQEMTREQLVMQTVVEREYKAAGLTFSHTEEELLSSAADYFGGEEAFAAFLESYDLQEQNYLSVLTLQMKTRELNAYYLQNGLVDINNEDAFSEQMRAWMDEATVEVVGDLEKITPETVADYLR